MRIAVRSCLTIAAFGGLLAVSGCQRTPDGSYEMASRERVADFLTLAPAAPEQDERLAMADFPPPPAGEEWRLNRRADALDDWQPVASAQPGYGVPVAAAAKSLSCHNESGATGRVRVVCE